MNIHDFHTELDYRGFQNLVTDLWKQGITLMAAYELAEAEHEKTFVKKRYSSFESFKALRYRHLKKESKQ